MIRVKYHSFNKRGFVENVNPNTRLCDYIAQRRVTADPILHINGLVVLPSYYGLTMREICRIYFDDVGLFMKDTDILHIVEVPKQGSNISRYC